MEQTRPVALGYQSIRLDSTPEELEGGRRAIEDYARAEGYALGIIFTEYAYAGRLSAFEALLGAVVRQPVEAVIVPTPGDLGRMPRLRQALRLRLEQVSGAHVVVVADA